MAEFISFLLFLPPPLLNCNIIFYFHEKWNTFVVRNFKYKNETRQLFSIFSSLSCKVPNISVRYSSKTKPQHKSISKNEKDCFFFLYTLTCYLWLCITAVSNEMKGQDMYTEVQHIFKLYYNITGWSQQILRYNRVVQYQCSKWCPFFTKA